MLFCLLLQYIIRALRHDLAKTPKLQWAIISAGNLVAIIVHKHVNISVLQLILC